jgi:uncharacterized protein YjdB/lysophospholipase L1-like esterase
MGGTRAPPARIAHNGTALLTPFHRSRRMRDIPRNLLRIGIAILVVFVACGEPNGPPAPVATVVLSPATTVDVVPGGSETIQAIPKDAAGHSLTNRVATWSSSDPTIVSVAAGIATGIAIGSATITATIEAHTASVDVRVREGGVVAPSGGAFTAFSGTVSLSAPAGAVTTTRNVTVAPAGASPNPRVVAGSAFDFGPASLTFAQSATLTLKYDPSKIDPDSPEGGLQLYELVSGSWRLVAGSTVNTSSKTVTGAVTHLGTYAVLMQPRVESVTINHDGESLRVARTLQFAGVCKDNEGQTLSRTILWSSSNTSVLTIDPVTGVATGVFPGEVLVTATSEGKTATARIIVVSGPAASIAAYSGNGQSAPLDGAVAVPPSVKVIDSENVPVKGVAVTFAVTGGGGSISGAAAVTDISGIATVGSWVLGPLPGTNTLTATSGTLTGSPVTFTATGIAPVPVAIFINSGDQQSAVAGSAVAVPPSVRVVDAEGRGVPGVSVTFSIRSGEGSSITGANPVSDAQGIARLGSWVVGMGGNSLFASAPGLTNSPLVFVAIGTAYVQLVTFGHSNTDLGYSGTDSLARAASYVSNARQSIRLSPSAPNSALQLAGKIEAKWRAVRPQTIRAVNHGIAGTRTGTGQTNLFSPNARYVVGGVTRFAGEVLGTAYPWNGGESGGSFPNGGVDRVQAFKARPQDFVYISMGTNDILAGDSPATVASNLEWMIDQWVGAGLPRDHVIMTTLAPIEPLPSLQSAIPDLNGLIRGFLPSRGIQVIELDKMTSNDGGKTWKSPTLHVTGSGIHYSESVRDSLAAAVVTYISGKTP